MGHLVYKMTTKSACYIERPCPFSFLKTSHMQITGAVARTGFLMRSDEKSPSRSLSRYPPNFQMNFNAVTTTHYLNATWRSFFYRAPTPPPPDAHIRTCITPVRASRIRRLDAHSFVRQTRAHSLPSPRISLPPRNIHTHTHTCSSA